MKTSAFLHSSLLLLTFAFSLRADAHTFDSGDRVVFFGDSITHVGAWTRDIMLYYVTRYPDRDVVFMNGGQGGGTAYNARRERIGQDVFSRKPTDVVMMFGVNDLHRFDYETNAAPEKIAAQRKSIADYGVSIRGLLQDLRGGVPEATLYCLTPVPCDDTATTAPNAGSLAGANGGITAESQLLVDAVAEAGATLVDANAAVNAYIRRRRLAEPDVVFSSDRVHLNEAVHFLMASTFLKTQAVSPVVSDVRLMEGRVLGARNASVTDLDWQDGKIAFTVLEKALPWPTGDEEKEVADRLPVGDDFNQQILAFHSLPAGRWTLRIDGEDVVTADERVWALGVNLGEIRTTPQYRQALAVRAQLKKDYATMIQRQAAGFSIRRAIQVLMERKGLNPASAEDRKAWYAEKRPTLKGTGLRDYDAVMANYDRLDEWAAECDAFFPALRALAKPVPHRYELVRAGTDEVR